MLCRVSDTYFQPTPADTRLCCEAGVSLPPSPGRAHYANSDTGVNFPRRLPLYPYKQTYFPCVGMSRMCHKETRKAQQRVFLGPRNASIENRRQIGAPRFAVESDAHKRHLENQVQAVFQAP
jgi:hypothetical protein